MPSIRAVQHFALTPHMPVVGTPRWMCASVFLFRSLFARSFRTLFLRKFAFQMRGVFFENRIIYMGGYNVYSDKVNTEETLTISIRTTFHD